jgi:hypothetical protein
VGHQANTTWWCGQGWPAPPYGVTASWPLSVSPLDSIFVSGEYELWLSFRPIPRIFPV